MFVHRLLRWCCLVLLLVTIPSFGEGFESTDSIPTTLKSYSLVPHSRGTDILSREITMLKLFLLSSDEESTLKERIRPDKGTNPFLLW